MIMQLIATAFVVGFVGIVAFPGHQSIAKL